MTSDGDAEELGGFGQPLPPDDRLWRHPSELAGSITAAPPPPARPVRAARLGAPWSTIAAAGLAGAVLATGALVATRSLGSDVVERTVIERVAVSPVVSSPMLPGAPGVVAVTDQVGPSVARIEATTANGVRRGSAVVFRSDGHLLTSATLVEGASAVVAVLGGRRLTATVVGRDHLTDVAVLSVEARDLPVAVLGTAHRLAVGQPVITLGAPAAGTAPVVVTGVVSALGRRLDRIGADPLFGLVQVDTASPDGSIGAPVLDSGGSVIGLSTEGDAEGRFGFATPVGIAYRVAGDLIESGSARHCWLGISGVDVDADVAGRLGVAGGAVVREVNPHSPADAAGLAGGDVLTELDGEPLQSVAHLVAELLQRRPGDALVVGYWRDGSYAEVEVTLAQRP